MPIQEWEITPGRFTVHVTEHDIAIGKRGDASYCAIALALKRTLDLADVEVDDDVFHIGPCVGKMKSLGAISVTGFIQQFDDESLYLPEPIDIDLELEYREYSEAE